MVLDRIFGRKGKRNIYALISGAAAIFLIAGANLSFKIWGIKFEIIIGILLFLIALDLMQDKVI